jgi:hypothetical protein
MNQSFLLIFLVLSGLVFGLEHTNLGCFVSSRLEMHFWGCQAGIRTRVCLTAACRADHSAAAHPIF